MPEILKHSNGATDWAKIFMGFAFAFVFVMQQYHTMMIADVKANTISRGEIADTYVPEHKINKSNKELEEQIALLTKALKQLTEGNFSHER